MLTSLAFSVSSLSRPVHDAPPRPEEPHLHRVRIQIQDLGNLFNRESFHLFQDQHQPVPLIQSIEQPFQALPRLQPIADIRLVFALLRGTDHLPSLLLAQVRFVHQRPDLPLSQHVPAFVDRDLVQPGSECRSLIKPLQRKVRFHEDLLRDVFYVLAPPDDPSGYSKYAMLMPPNQLLKRFLILMLSPPHQFAVVSRVRWTGNTSSSGLRRGKRLQGPCFWDACHGFLVTVSISGLPCLAPLVSFRPPEIFSLLLCLPLRHNTFMIIGDRLRALREEKKLSQGDIEKRTGLLRCYISRVENGHTVPAIETLEKLARALEVPLYQLFYDGEEPPQLPNLPKRKSSDDIAWGSVGKEARFLNKLRRLLSKAEEGDRKLILYMAQKMANR